MKRCIIWVLLVWWTIGVRHRSRNNRHQQQHDWDDQTAQNTRYDDQSAQQDSSEITSDQLRYVEETGRQMKKIDFELIEKLGFVPLEGRLMGEASIYLENNETMIMSREFSPVLNANQVMCASIRFNNSIEQIGWDKLYLKTYKECDPLVQIWSAGYLEGYVSNEQIKDFYDNLVHLHDQERKALQSVFDQFDLVEQNIRKKITNDNLNKIGKICDYVYWGNIALYQAQIDGLLLGYNSVNPYKLKIHDLYLINSDGEVPELLQVFKNKRKQQFNSQSFFRLKQENNPTQFQEMKTRIDNKVNVKNLLKRYKVNNGDDLFLKKLMKSHCSAFLKVIKNQDNKISDVMVGHSTWDDYSEMLRVYKYYEIEMLGEGVPHGLGNKRISFSSYPGCLSSTDDWYIINDKFIITETTLEVMQENLYRYILDIKHYVPDFMRVMLANRMATNGLSWVFWLSYYNTGTYNSQWMILDLDVIERSINRQEYLEPNSFIIMEQMPGNNNINFADMSLYLTQNSYWASYNVPFFDQIRQVSGYNDLQKSFINSESFSWSQNPRANIFRYYSNKIKSITDMKWLMQLNEYNIKSNIFDFNPNVTQSLLRSINNNPGNAISARFDLSDNLVFKKNVGAIDSKITNFRMARKSECLAISGPTYQNQSPFVWSLAGGNDPHDGLPDRY